MWQKECKGFYLNLFILPWEIELESCVVASRSENFCAPNSGQPCSVNLLSASFTSSRSLKRAKAARAPQPRNQARKHNSRQQTYLGDLERAGIRSWRNEARCSFQLRQRTQRASDSRTGVLTQVFKENSREIPHNYPAKVPSCCVADLFFKNQEVALRKDRLESPSESHSERNGRFSLVLIRK